MALTKPYCPCPRVCVENHKNYNTTMPSRNDGCGQQAFSAVIIDRTRYLSAQRNDYRIFWLCHTRNNRLEYADGDLGRQWSRESDCY